MEYVLLDGRLEISNNRVERAIKEQVISRKNWLFSTSLKGTCSNGITLSVMRSAEVNGLNCRKYLEYLFTELPNLPVPGDAEAIPDYLPWSPKVRANCSR
ncbi:IS66 family transposase [Lacticaseibacillus rhamnosus]|uniref:IS66 family transposase n=1 Tax=Lacticaseibacillus rhamnosus TaxID=47715 RepID=UPI003DA91CCF